MTDINRDEWLAAVKVAETDGSVLPPSDALTLIEFAALIGMKRYGAKVRMDTLLRLGKAVRVTKLFRRSDGAVVTTCAYRLLKETPDDGRAHHRMERDAGRIRHAPPGRSRNGR